MIVITRWYGRISCADNPWRELPVAKVNKIGIIVFVKVFI